MKDANCYSVRLVNPFLGTKQIVSTEQARATSSDGINWRIQIRNDIYKTPWSSLAIPEQHDRYFVYGNWSPQTGLVRVPIHPSLYEDHVLQSVEDLFSRLKPATQQLPFVPKDTLELWLLDRDCSQAVALLATRLPDEESPAHRLPRWYVGQEADSVLSRKLLSDESSYSTNAQTAFDHAIQHRCGTPLIGYWIQRQPDNSGVIVSNHAGKPVSRVTSLPASAFPECLLSEDWADKQFSKLVNDYLSWQAPLLLMLPLSTARRRTLENHAQQRPLAVQQYHRLYPSVENASLLNKIRVEARLRAAAIVDTERNNG